MSDPRLDELWGSTLDHVELDLINQRLTLEITLLNGGQVSKHRLVAEGLRTFKFFSDIPAPWSYAEITEISARHNVTARGAITLWSHESGLSFEADELVLDGERLGPSS